MLLASGLLSSWLALPMAGQPGPVGQACPGALAGRVLNQRTGQPLPGAVLRLAETSAAAAADGQYHFHQLCAGRYHLRITFVG